MNILVVGGGGREHAVIKKLRKNPEVSEIFALPGNGGIAADATCVPIGATDLDGIVRFARENQVDYAVVTPDDPLVLGCVDRLNEVGIPCFGPRANAAILEGSKAFAKDLMKRYGIPTARYETFTELSAALEYINTQPAPLVVKADGLALGKGAYLPDPPGGGAGGHGHDGQRKIWRIRSDCGHRGVFGGPGGVGFGVYRRNNRKAHGLLHGS